MDSGPRDHRHSARIQCYSRCHASCKKDTVWEHSPTRRKYVDTLRLNRGAPLFRHSVTVPQCYQGPLYPWALHLRTLCHVAPHTGTHVDRPRGLLPRVSATCAPRGPPGLCHVASVPRGTPGRSRAPCQPPPRHVSTYR